MKQKSETVHGLNRKRHSPSTYFFTSARTERVLSHWNLSTNCGHLFCPRVFVGGAVLAVWIHFRPFLVGGGESTGFFCSALSFLNNNKPDTMPLHSRRTPVRFSQRQLEARRRLSLSTSNDEADDCTSNDPFSTPQVRKTQQVKRRNKRRRLQCDSPSTSATAGVVITPEPTPSLSSFPISPTSAKRRRPLAERKPKLDNSSGRLPWSEFRDLQVPPHELRSSATLTTGQCFHWTDVTPEPASQHQNHQITSAWGVHNAKEWIGTLRLSSKERTHADTVVVHVRESEDTTMYRILCHFSSQTDAPVEDASPLFYDQMLREYFQLEEPLQPLYEEWATQCPRMRQIAQRYVCFFAFVHGHK